MSNNFRKAAFFSLDALSGGRVLKYLDDLRQFSVLGAVEQDQLVSERLTKLLRHASTTTMHYRAWHGVDDLGSWPVLNKRHIQEDSGRLLSDAYRGKRLVEKRTSGSYGTPMQVLFSGDKWARRNAEVIHFNRSAGLDVGNAYLHVSTDKKSTLHRWRKNTIVIDASIMSEDWLRRMMMVLQRHPDRVLVGFTSAVFALAGYARANARPGSIRLAAVITAAEPLPGHIRRVIEAAFRCPVFNRYASSETGVLAFSGESDDVLAVNRASYIVEVLALGEDRPAREGEPGRVVVTDLFSFAMPLIRYDIGDLAVVHRASRWGVQGLAQVEGRVVEAIYDASGAQVSWAALYDLFDDTENILQYQFIQRGKRAYELLLVTADAGASVNTHRLLHQLQALLGAEAMISVIFKDSIPPLASGKRPMVMNTSTQAPTTFS